MSLITVNTPFNIDLEFKVAAFLNRLAAMLVDIVIITLYYWLVLGAIYPLLGLSDSADSLVSMFLIVLPVLLYQLSFEIFFNGQTLGKKLTGIKIIDKEGKEPTLSQYLLRWILNIGNTFIYVLPKLLIISPFFVLLVFIAYIPDAIVMLISLKMQRIGDLVAGTVVIDAKYQPDISSTIYQEIEVKAYEPIFHQVMKLSDRDINGIKNLLQTRISTKEQQQHCNYIVLKIKKVLNIETQLEGEDFLRQLLFDYNYITSKR